LTVPGDTARLTLDLLAEWLVGLGYNRRIYSFGDPLLTPVNSFYLHAESIRIVLGSDIVWIDAGDDGAVSLQRDSNLTHWITIPLSDPDSLDKILRFINGSPSPRHGVEPWTQAWLEA
jgi:hypothetical protein